MNQGVSLPSTPIRKGVMFVKQKAINHVEKLLQSVTFTLQMTCNKSLNIIFAANVAGYFDGLICIILKSL